jgi:integrase
MNEQLDRFYTEFTEHLRRIPDRYQIDTHKMLEVLSQQGCDHPRIPDLLRYAQSLFAFEHRPGVGYAPGTINKKISMVLRSLNAARDLYTEWLIRGDIQHSEANQKFFERIASGYDLCRTLRERTRGLQTDRRTTPPQLLSQDLIGTWVHSSPPDTAIIIKILYITGMRLNELLALKRSQITSNANTCSITITRSQTQRTVYLPNTYHLELSALYPPRSDSDLIFWDFRRHHPLNRVTLASRLASTAQQAGITQIPATAQSIRHSFRHLLESSGSFSQQQIDQYLGNTTAIRRTETEISPIDDSVLTILPIFEFSKG